MKILNQISALYYQIMASKHLGNRDYNKAIELYHKSNVLIPNKAYILSALGHSYYLAGQYENAKGTFEKSLDLNPNDYITREFMIRTLSALDTPIENVIIHLNIYLQSQKPHNLHWPFMFESIGNVIIKTFTGKKDVLTEYLHDMDKSATDFYLWAKDTVENYNKSNS